MGTQCHECAKKLHVQARICHSSPPFNSGRPISYGKDNSRCRTSSSPCPSAQVRPILRGPLRGDVGFHNNDSLERFASSASLTTTVEIIGRRQSPYDMTVEEVTCSVLVNRALADDVSPAGEATGVCIKDCPDIGIETRLQWARRIAQEFLSCSGGDSIRPWAFICSLDGTVERLAMKPPKGCDKVYPVRFRILPDTILRLADKERIKRSELFVLGSLLYEVNSGSVPFENLNDDEV
jgi:hypothetical protein